MVKNILFIEGAIDDTNGDLRQGFHKLLAQKLAGKMPRIKMGNGITTTVRVFKKNTLSERGILLIDLDAPATQKSQKLAEYNLNDVKGDVFFMIQAMEAWFLAQPQVLDNFYGVAISQKLPKKNAQDIPQPAEYLMGLTRNTGKGTYRKIEHGVKLLESLDAHQLEQASVEFANLIKRLESI